MSSQLTHVQSQYMGSGYLDPATVSLGSINRSISVTDLDRSVSMCSAVSYLTCDSLPNTVRPILSGDLDRTIRALIGAGEYPTDSGMPDLLYVLYDG
jgi:hypothetical protein